MNATPLPWSTLLGTGERTVSARVRRVFVNRRCAIVRATALTDYLIVQPGTDPITGKPGPAHTRALLTLEVPANLSPLSMSVPVPCTATVAEDSRAVFARVWVRILQTAHGLELQITPGTGVSERAGRLMRMALVISDESAEVAA